MGKILLINTGPQGPVTKFAGAAAGRIAEYGVSAVYVCPVPGADETARIIAGGAPVEALPGFSQDVKSFWKDLDAEDEALLDCSPDRVPPDARLKLPFQMGIEELRSRLEAAFNGIAEKHRKETVAVVTQRHLAVVMVLHLLHMHSNHYRQIVQQDGAINLFEVRGGMPSALYINDICHLHGLI